MFNFDLDYFLLNLFLLLTFIIAGNKVSFGSKCGKYLWLCIVVFTFVLGSRYMRGNDYLRYQHTFLHDDDKSQVVFTCFNQFLRWFGIGKYSFFYIYSIPFVVCALTYMKTLRPYACYLFPMFIMAFIFFHEYSIRQALGFSFVFMYMYYLFYKRENIVSRKEICEKWMLCVFYALLSCSIHSVNVLLIAMVTGIYMLSFTTISWKISIPLYVFSALFFTSFFDWNYLNNALMLLGGVSDKFEIYTNRSTQFFSIDAFQESWSRSFLGKFFEAIGHCSLFYLGCKTIKEKCKNRMFCTLFNVYVIGTIMCICFWNYELFRRVFDPMLAFWCFVLPIVLVHKKEMKLRIHEKLLYFNLLFFLNDYLSYLLKRGAMTLFIWDI